MDEQDMTQTKVDNYDGTTCPYCDMPDSIRNDHWNDEGQYQQVHCATCGKEWEELFTRNGIQEDNGEQWFKTPETGLDEIPFDIKENPNGN